jgi:hypothetical protein
MRVRVRFGEVQAKSGGTAVLALDGESGATVVPSQTGPEGCPGFLGRSYSFPTPEAAAASL